MLFWLVGFNTYGLIAKIEGHIEGLLMEINFDGNHPMSTGIYPPCPHLIADTLTETSLYAASVIYKLRHINSKDAFSNFNFKYEYRKLHYSPDPAGLLCQLRDYTYACHHQLAFLKSQCNRDKLSGGWKHHHYGSDITASNSPLQAFLTDGWDSDFETHLFDPCNLCLKSRTRMGFTRGDLPRISQQGSVISSILTPSCGGENDYSLRAKK
ncbi:hypothetical protein BBBOND_0108980 [Babesia bigemina]|uniref:Uncharacterized protein n=1 Tax=Babesia bigemina TaxID=5866 RepID=A0A061DA26_BABBI|nr:hypothetical protein BBBOND_0108980 [Babesia bigemina]CDR94600.1 hypothetical protein BBBOND_0108980 [Babesia bigemina]|eukprot:XP_012766786.1 hypothetical protein BBBOND_0108980 [Babesia bigemina]